MRSRLIGRRFPWSLSYDILFNRSAYRPDRDPDANDTHFRWRKLRWKPVSVMVVDKPFTVTLSQARSGCACARTHGPLLSVYNRRWDSDFDAEGLAGGWRARRGVLVLNPALIVSVPGCARPLARARRAVSGTILAPHLLDRGVAAFGLPVSMTIGFSATASGRAVYRLFPRDFYPYSAA